MGLNFCSDLISVLLPVYKEPLEWVKEAVNSILFQTYENIELVIMIDNPDRKDICVWLDSLGDQRVCYYVNEKNIGLVDTLNKGIKLCHGEVIARMDADDISTHDRIIKQVSYMLNNRCDLVGCEVETFNNEGSLGITRMPNSYSKMLRYIKNGGSIPHPTWLINKKMFFEMEGYRNIEYAEDYDFLLRAVIKGYKLGAVNEVCLKYRQNPSGISQDNKGKQKYIAKLLQKQGKYNKVFDVKYFESKVDKSEKELSLYKNYYKYTRSIANSIKTKRVFGIISSVSRFKLKYLKIMYYDIFQSLYNRVLIR